MLSPRPTTFLDATDLIPGFRGRVTVATETFQRTGSFKFRAAYQVAKNVAQPHIVSASSGNFGQALALACRIFEKKCTVVMPSTSAKVKIDAVRSYGAIVDLIDVTKISREARVQQLADEHPDAYISSAFDDPWVIAGNASLGVEILAGCPDVETIIAPIGGGGLTAGLVMAVQEENRKVKVVAAEPQSGNDASRSFQAGKLISNEDEPQTIADGARTRSLGKRNWEILHAPAGLSSVIEVPDEAICDAVRALFLKLNLKAEPTGALAVAAVMTHAERLGTGGSICCVVTGGNVDPIVYAEILEGRR